MVRLKPKPKKYALLRVRGGMEQGEEIGEVVGLLYYSSHFVDLQKERIISRDIIKEQKQRDKTMRNRANHVKMTLI